MRKPRRITRERFSGLSFNRLIPNILTVMALCAGLTAIRYALVERWDLAVFAIVAAGLLDALDGRIARLLKGQSKFGAELDSLADTVSFGVAPAMIMYLWSMDQAGRMGWVMVLIYCVCCVLRLARFNTLLDDDDRPAGAYNFFTGVPAPMGAALALSPLILWLEVQQDWIASPVLVGMVLTVVSFLMVSRLPTFAFKQFRVAKRWILPLLLCFGLFAALLVNAPFPTMFGMAVIYVSTFPFSVRAYRILERRSRELRGELESAPAEGDLDDDDENRND